MLEEDARTVVAGIKPVLDCVDLEVAPQPDSKPSRPDTIIERCKVVWENFKSFNCDAIVTDVTHALAVVWSHYPAIYLQAIVAEFTGGIGETEHQ